MSGDRPAHLRPSLVLLVENLLGALLLGVLLERLARRGPETTAARRVRLTLGTGLLGGFTTFSTLAIEVERLTAAGRPALGLLYGLVSVVVGVVAAFAGVVLAARRSSGRGPSR